MDQQTKDLPQTDIGSQPQSTALTPYNASSATAAMATLLGSAGQPAIHNFTGDGMDQWRMTAIARGPNCLGMKDVEGKEFRLVYFYIHPVQVAGKTPGEFVDSIRCVCFDDKLRAVAFVSEIIAQSLATIFQHCGIGPWSPPLLIKFVATERPGGKRMYSIVPA